MTLDEQRKKQEVGLVVVAESDMRINKMGGNSFLVILRRNQGCRDGKQPYFAHRYFIVGDNNWDVSIDNVGCDEAIKLAMNDMNDMN